MIFNPKLIADRFCDYFADVGPNLAKTIPKASSTFLSYLDGNFINSLFFEPTTEQEIGEIINSLRYCVASGYDNIPMWIVLQCLANKITEAIDNKKYTIGIFLDLSKAFDTVNHNILLKKLEHYILALDWITSYLSGRQQFVEYNGTSSSYNRHLKIDVYGKRQTASEFFILQLYYNGFDKSFKIY